MKSATPLTCGFPTKPQVRAFASVFPVPSNTGHGGKIHSRPRRSQAGRRKIGKPVRESPRISGLDPLRGIDQGPKIIGWEDRRVSLRSPGKITKSQVITGTSYSLAALQREPATLSPGLPNEGSERSLQTGLSGDGRECVVLISSQAHARHMISSWDMMGQNIRAVLTMRGSCTRA